MAKQGISKSTGYLTRIFSIESDLFGAIVAYGSDNLKMMIDLIEAGRADDVRREINKCRTKRDLYNNIREMHNDQDEAA